MQRKRKRSGREEGSWINGRNHANRGVDVTVSLPSVGDRPASFSSKHWQGHGLTVAHVSRDWNRHVHDWAAPVEHCAVIVNRSVSCSLPTLQLI